MKTRWKAAIVAAAAVLLAGAALAQAQAQELAGLAYTPDGKMPYPKDYRTWILLSTGFDMSYVENAAGVHLFDNVFASRGAHDAFLKTGAWPDGTVLVLEHRAAGSDPTFVKHGEFQSGPPVNVEAHVKDSAKGGWAFYAWGKDGALATMIPKTANCYSCHAEHGATDTTFTQFYPTLHEAK